MIFRKLGRIWAVAATLIISSGQVTGDGLPGEYLLSNRWRQVFLFRSPVDNPAFMMEEQYPSVRAVNLLPVNNSATLLEAGITYPFSLYSTVGFTIVAERGGKVGGFTFQGDSLVYSGSTRNNNFFFIGSFATNPFGKFSAGANLSLASQGNFGKPTWGAGIDLGFSYRLILDPLVGYHVLGFSYKNLLSPAVSSNQKMPYSSQLSTQYHAGFFRNRLEFQYQLSLSDFMAKPAIFSGSRELEWDMEFQLGFTPVSYLKLKGFTDINQWKRLGSFGFALGGDLSYLNKGKELSVYYQFRKNVNSELMGNQSVYVIAQFGSHREELFARRIAQLARISPSNLYSMAMDAYHRENYWDAYFYFSRLMAEYPDFFKNDASAYYSASSLEKLDMRKSALKAYSDLKERYPQSRFVADADLGMMRVYYREGMYNDVERQFRMIWEGNAPDEIKQYAAYYMGETEVVRMEYLRALVYFAMVQSSHEAYVFAQHTSATVQEKSAGQRSVIIDHLRNVIDAENVKSPAQKEIVNRSLVLLGYIYYEDNSLSKAVTALRMVPEESYYFEDAQLGLGWLAVKARQWKDCITTGEKLVSRSKKTIIKSEGKLIQAYGYIQQQKYETAENLLLEAASELDSYQNISLEMMEREKNQYDSSRALYDSLASEIINIARTRAPKKKIDLLHKRQSDIKGSIDSFQKSSDEQRRVRFFERGIYILKEDLEYAVATVQRILRGTGTEQQKVRTREERKIDDEIEELKGKMQDIGD